MCVWSKFLNKYLNSGSKEFIFFKRLNTPYDLIEVYSSNQSNIAMNRQLPYGDWRLVVYLLLLGSSHPYSWLILEENRR